MNRFTRSAAVCHLHFNSGFRRIGARLVLACALFSQAAVATLIGIAPSAANAQTAARQEYILGAGDTIRITVYQSPDLSLETRISENGAISYPLLGSVRLGGLSVTAAERALSDGLRNGNFLKSPQVSILISQVRGNQANALGMVGKPGRYPIEVAGMKLSDLVAMAGGVVPGGADLMTLSGVRNGQAFRRQIDLPAMLSGTGGEDFVIQNGDTVYVDRQPQVYIYGEVQKPGVMRIERNMTIMQALASGGGLTQRGTEKGLRIHRQGAGGKVEVIEPALNDAVRDGDVIYVRQSLF